MCNSVTLGFFVELFDDLREEMQTQVDVLGLFESLAINACLRGSLGTRQIDQVQFRHGLHILSHLLTFQLYNEYAVRTGGGIVFGRFRHNTVRVSDEEQIQRVLFVLRSVHTEVLEYELLV